VPWKLVEVGLMGELRVVREHGMKKGR